MRPQLSKSSEVDDMGRNYQTFSRQLLTTADWVHADGHVSLNVVNMQHMLSLGVIDTRFINSEYAVSIANLHNNNNVTGNLDGLGERGFHQSWQC